MERESSTEGLITDDAFGWLIRNLKLSHEGLEHPVRRTHALVDVLDRNSRSLWCGG